MYIRDAVLLKYIRAMLFYLSIIMCDAVLLDYIRAMLGVATPGRGNPKSISYACWRWNCTITFAKVSTRPCVVHMTSGIHVNK